jgi:GNAT superfamily N-acetyltransferase
MNLREARPGDETAIHGLIVELAVYEREPDAVINTPENLYKDLFEDKICSAFVLESESEIIGFALYYAGYSTWKGRTIYLEDLYVKPAFRQGGAGSMLFDAVVDKARALGVKRMDWQVLDWNEPAIQFYKKKQATLDAQWINGRLFF